MDARPTTYPALCSACGRIAATPVRVNTRPPPNEDWIFITLKCRACDHQWIELRASSSLVRWSTRAG